MTVAITPLSHPDDETHARIAKAITDNSVDDLEQIRNIERYIEGPSDADALFYKVGVRGGRPLHLAAHQPGGLSVCSFLLDHGANIEAGDRFGYTPIFYARFPEIAHFLACRGANLQFRHLYGYTIYEHFKSEPEVLRAFDQGHAAFEQMNLRAKLPSVADELQSQGLRQNRGRRL